MNRGKSMATYKSFFNCCAVTLVCGSLAAGVAQAQSTVASPVKEKKIKIVASVGDYLPEVMRDTFDNGTIQVFDGTRVRVSSPRKFAGRELVFHHDQPAPEDSPWRAKGRLIRFQVDAGLLSEAGITLFAGAATNLRLAPLEQTPSQSEDRPKGDYGGPIISLQP
jgi:hypothetical protein